MSAPRWRQRLGQHFLVQGGAVRQVVDAIAPLRGERFLEVGPGRGAITWPLLEAGARVLAVEIDPALVRRLRQIPEASAEFTVVRGDILKVDLPDLLERELPPGRGIRAVGNLPYSVASPAILRFLSLPERFTDLTLMVQKEVADRILSPPGTRDYGVLTLLCAARASTARLLDLSPGCFQPPPEVRSTLLRFTPRPPCPFHGSNVQRGWPVPASKATTFKPAVVMNITPSTTIGLHSMVVAGRSRISSQRYTHAGVSRLTFDRLICVSAEYLVPAASPP